MNLYSKIDKNFYKTLLILGLPIALQNLISSFLNMIDTVMVGQLGEVQIAAVGLANQYFFILVLMFFGINSGAGIFIAQYWGKRDISNIARAMGLSIIVGIITAVVFTIPGVLFPKSIMRIFTTDLLVIEEGSKFLYIISFSYIITAISFTYATALRCTGNVKLPVAASAIALVLNTILNFILITGKFGFPALGVSGSATATLISRVIELTIMLLFVYGKDYDIAVKFKSMFKFSLGYVKQFFKLCIPVIMNETFWSLGATMYLIIYARMGTSTIAAMNIVGTIERLGFILILGIGNAAAIMIGNKIGEGERETAVRYAKDFIKMSPIVGIITGGILIGISPFILTFYNVSPDVMHMARNVLIIVGIGLSIRMVNFVGIIGVLRSGGDTTMSMIIDLGGIWLIGVPLAYLGGIVLKLDVTIVYLMLFTDEAVKLFFILYRIKSGKWIKDVTVAG